MKILGQSFRNIFGPIHSSYRAKYCSTFHEPLCSSALSLTMRMTDSWALFSAALRTTWSCQYEPLLLNRAHLNKFQLGYWTPSSFQKWDTLSTVQLQSCVVSLSGSCTALSVCKGTWKNLTPKKNTTSEWDFRIPTQIISEQKMVSTRTKVIPTHPNGGHIFNKN